MSEGTLSGALSAPSRVCQREGVPEPGSSLEYRLWFLEGAACSEPSPDEVL